MRRKFSIFAAGVLVISLVGGVIVSAQEVPPPVPFGREGQFGPGGRFDERGWPGHPGHSGLDIRLDWIETIAEEAGLTPREVVGQLRDGATPEDVITSNGGSVEAVIADVMSAFDSRIDRALAAGRITDEQAEQLRTQFEVDLRARMTSDVWAQGIGRAASVSLLRLAVEQTGLTAAELRDALQGGATLAEVLTANGVSLETFTADAGARLQARLNVLVVDGRITQERADELLAQFQARLTEQLNQVWPGRGRGAAMGV